MKLIERRIWKLEGDRASLQVQNIVLKQILERRHRRLVAAGFQDEPVEVQLCKTREYSKIMHKSLKGAGLAEHILARRRQRQQEQRCEFEGHRICG